MFPFLQHFTLLANWNELVCSNRHPAVIIEIRVSCWGIWKTTGNSLFFFFLNKDFHVSNLVIVHQMFAREIPVRCGRINDSNTCFCVVLCLFVSMAIGFWFMTGDPGYINSANNCICAQLSVSSYFNLSSISFLYSFCVPNFSQWECLSLF